MSDAREDSREGGDTDFQARGGRALPIKVPLTAGGAGPGWGGARVWWGARQNRARCVQRLGLATQVAAGGWAGLTWESEDLSGKVWL